jgi:hypothetical protein
MEDPFKIAPIDAEYINPAGVLYGMSFEKADFFAASSTIF